MVYIKDLFSIPNQVSMLRLLMAPVLIYLAVEQRPTLYLLAVCFTIFTDLLDGFLARALNQITELGSRLDSWGDFTVYSTLAVCAWLLWPETVARYQWPALAIVLSFSLPPLIGLFKFGSLTSYHTWSVKVAVGITIISYLLLFSGVLDWPIYIAAALCLLAASEEIAITVLLPPNQSPPNQSPPNQAPPKRTDIRSVFSLLGR